MLTEKQRQLAAENERLIYYALNKFGYPLDEFYGIGAIGLCKAAKMYNPQKGSFANAAVWQIRSACSAEIQKRKRIKRIQHIISLETPIKAENGSDNLTLSDIIPSYDDTFDEVEDKAEAEELLDRLRHSSYISNRDKKIFSKWVNGETRKELSRKYGVSRERIRQIINSVESRCKTLIHS